MKKGKVRILAERCKGCNLCILECKKGELKQGKTVNKQGYSVVEFVNNGKCNGCTLCAIVCPDAAIEVILEAEE
ncbi:MAG TPA: 4Fe-4S binding protein [Candidatus Goldiibacteriota bacterium]|nr:4Fe-4S binding protein [Candidatus Goldiibacteriota bacterium]HRQ43638.1 4Fe-4S binding protein [Candidatus Goldiibacteriota bacterium]